MERKMIDPKEEIEIMRAMNEELMDENEHLRNQIRALEELAIDTKKQYNESPIEEEYYQNDFDFTLGETNE
jgi:DNA-binding HxlR family transcriptional regulator